jgi:UDP-N-acetylmuramate dehydrogenase
MTEIKTGFSLESLNTFGIRATAEYYTEVGSPEEIEELINTNIFRNSRHLIMGGGSNLLFTRDFPGLVIHPDFKGIEIVEETPDKIVIRAGAGMVWDEFVRYSVERNYGGAENLSGIPGSVGASPIQNIGAYGAEAREIIDCVEGFDFQERSWKTFDRKDCVFSYRNSIFKTEYKNSFLVSHVTFRLIKNPHELKTHYGNIEEELKNRDRSVSSLREVILRIRSSKLPDVKEFGNAGSFFKNPVIESSLAKQLREAYPDLPVYPEVENRVKLSAAWLIDRAGLKGYPMGKVAVHKNQPLVLINLGGATGREIMELSGFVQETVQEKFGIKLEPEVNIY